MNKKQQNQQQQKRKDGDLEIIKEFAPAFNVQHSIIHTNKKVNNYDWQYKQFYGQVEINYNTTVNGDVGVLLIFKEIRFDLSKEVTEQDSEMLLSTLKNIENNKQVVSVFIDNPPSYLRAKLQYEKVITKIC